jgi:hypothetical protein
MCVVAGGELMESISTAGSKSGRLSERESALEEEKSKLSPATGEATSTAAIIASLACLQAVIDDMI